MALWECAECTTRYAVGAPCCPHCGSDLRVNEKTLPPEEGDEMAKITVHGGPSNAAADSGGEDVSAGTSSSTSSEKEPTSPEQSDTPSPPPAPTTASRSGKGRTAKRTARGMAGGREAGMSETGSADE
jgi:hypothetical protein